MGRIDLQDCRQLIPSVGLTEPSAMVVLLSHLFSHAYFDLNPVWDVDPCRRMWLQDCKSSVLSHL